MAQLLKDNDLITDISEHVQDTLTTWFGQLKTALDNRKKLREIEKDLSTYSDRDMLSIGMSKAQILAAAQD